MCPAIANLSEDSHTKIMYLRCCHVDKTLLLGLGLHAYIATSAVIDTSNLASIFQSNGNINATGLNATSDSIAHVSEAITQFHCTSDETWVGPRGFVGHHCPWAMNWLQTKALKYGSQDLYWPSIDTRGPVMSDIVLTPQKYKFCKFHPTLRTRSVR